MTDVADVNTWVYDPSRDVERPIREIQGGAGVELSLDIQTKLIAKILVEGQYDTLLLNGEESLIVDRATTITITRKDVQVTFVSEVDKDDVQLFQIYDNDAAWSVYRGKDFGGHDVESIANWEQTLKSVSGLKAYTKKKGYSGVSTRWGHAFFKSVNHVITESELNDVDDVVTYVFDPSYKDIERPLPEGGWTFYKDKDFGGHDVESIADWADRLNGIHGLKAYIKEKGYKGVSLYRGNAFFK